MSGRSYRDLEVWQLSFAFAKEVYEFTRHLPSSEVYGLSSQMQRAAISIPSNIAEGQQRAGAKEFKQFLHIARGSAAELATQIQLATEIYKIDSEAMLTSLDRIQRMLYGLIQKL